MLSLLSGSARPEIPRTSIHLLLLGPSAVGKTLLLRSLVDASPHGLLIMGNDVSKADLTASVTKDVVTGDIQVDAGACVLASGGHCGIDDLCRSPAAAALLEVMDAQCCTVSKTGSMCRLPAATVIVATSRSTGARSLVEGTKLPEELLHRFDLTFVLKNERLATPTAGTDLRSRIRRTSVKDLLPRELLTDFVFYARTQLNPILTTAARDAIRDLYAFLKSKSTPFRPVTVRVLETLVRLCKARARADLSELVTPQHVLDVEEVVGLSTLGDCEFASAGRKRKGRGLGSMLAPLQRQLRSVVAEHRTRVLSRALVLNVARDLVAVSECHDSAEQLVEAANDMGMLIKTSSDEFTVDVT
ncbi:MAG: hypothetical protein KVP17_004397 [Porospora cf. gigantea B]|nr:MAG: hypothetical protein KVP17_004397 [Porospora cf. gigantea B]